MTADGHAVAVWTAPVKKLVSGAEQIPTCCSGGLSRGLLAILTPILRFRRVVR